MNTPDQRPPLLLLLGERVKSIRARRGLTRKQLALAAQVSERHLANLEYGEGNASILVLQQVAEALECSLAELIGDFTTGSPEWLLLRDLLVNRDDGVIRQVRMNVQEVLGRSQKETPVSQRIALIGLRGAGKTSLGQRLATHLGMSFIEVGKEVERLAGCPVSEIQALYGVNAYRRYERRAIQEILQNHSEAVIATPGGLVADAGSFNEVLSHCTVVWLQARPEDHMNRVIAQGDLRPMAASSEAMEDLKGILAGRQAFYAKAHLHLNTSLAPLDETAENLYALVRQHIGRLD
jgi:XRE family transcriptional regulator, aerobic/anaerobic benzoate catabolism transcriptional regulator